MHNEKKTEIEDGKLDRWTLIRDVSVFQAKLLVDGLRDLILVPVSLTFGLVSLLRGGKEPGTEFYELLRVGRRSERWINLFGAAERMYGPSADDDHFAAQDMDEMVSRVETFIIDEYQKGGVTSQAKTRLDKALNTLTEMTKKDRVDED